MVRLLAFLLTLALVLGAVALVAFRDKINLDSLKRYITYRTLETGDDRQPTSFRLESGGKGGCLGVGDDLLVYSASGARLFSVSGVEYLTESVLLTTPVADGAGSAAVVYDAGGYALRVLSDRSTVLETSAAQGHEILSARLNAAGRLTVTSREPGYKGSVTVYDGSYQPLVSIRLSSRFLMDGLLSDDNRTVAVLTAGQTDDAFDSALALYHLDEDAPYASCSLGGSAVLDLKYDADSFWALGDEALSIVQLDGSLAGQYDYGGRYLKAFSLGGDRSATLLLGKYRAGSGATLLTVDAAGQKLAALELDDQVLGPGRGGPLCGGAHRRTAGSLHPRSGALRLSGHHRRSPGRGAPLRRHRLAHHRGDRPSLHSRITARYLYDNALSHLRHRHSPHSGRVCPAGRQAWAAPLPVRPAGCPRGLHRRQRRLRHHGPQGGRVLRA